MGLVCGAQPLVWRGGGMAHGASAMVTTIRRIIGKLR